MKQKKIFLLLPLLFSFSLNAGKTRIKKTLKGELSVEKKKMMKSVGKRALGDPKSPLNRKKPKRRHKKRGGARKRK